MKKTIIITGSTDGIGKITAMNMAKEGHTVYIHGRSREKINNTIQEIKKASDNQEVFGYIADLSDRKEVLNLAEQIKNELPSLDILINNAGVFFSPEMTNKKGIDLRMMVNYLAPYMLTKELTPVLERSEAPRIINLSSAAQAPVSLSVLRGKETASVNSTYAQSKLALTMWSFVMAEEFPNITVIAVNPGSLLNTKMANEAYGQYWSPAEKGSNIIYDLAILDRFKNESGKYFDNDAGHFNNAHPDAYDREKIQKLMEETRKISG